MPPAQTLGRFLRNQRFLPDTVPQTRPRKCLRGAGRSRAYVCSAIPIDILGHHSKSSSSSSSSSAVSTMHREIDPSPYPLKLQRPQSEFVHPYNSKPRWWKAFFCIRRGGFLLLVWIPVALVSLAASLTGSRRLRRAAIRYAVWTVEACGMTFLKFGQWVSMRPDIFSPQVVEAFRELCTNTTAHSMHDTRLAVRESFGCEIEDLFQEFDQKPVASGSVAQVHRAKLHKEFAMQDGSLDVAVKVRHPTVLEESFMDINFIYGVAASGIFNLYIPFQKEEFLTSLQRQLDLRWEGFNMQQFSENFRSDIQAGVVCFPAVCNHLVSSSILVEAWAPGRPVMDLFSSVGGTGHGWDVIDHGKSAERIDVKMHLAEVIFDLNMKMFLRDNFAHGDMHGGNMLWEEEGNSITVLDTGLTVSLDKGTSFAFHQFMRSMCVGDVDGIEHRLLEFDVTGRSVDRAKFHKDLTETVQKWVGPRPVNPMQASKAPDGGPISVGDLMGGIYQVLQQHQLCLRGDVASTLCAIAIGEGLIRQLDPNYDMMSLAMGYFVRFRVLHPLS